MSDGQEELLRPRLWRVPRVWAPLLKGSCHEIPTNFRNEGTSADSRQTTPCRSEDEGLTCALGTLEDALASVYSGLREPTPSPDPAVQVGPPPPILGTMGLREPRATGSGARAHSVD